MDSQLNLIQPHDEGYDSTLGARGKPDVTSPVLNPLIQKMLEDKETEVQLPDGSPFTVAQVRYWQPRGNALLPAGKRISVAGGNGKNIRIAIVDTKKKKTTPSSGTPTESVVSKKRRKTQDEL